MREALAEVTLVRADAAKARADAANSRNATGTAKYIEQKNAELAQKNKELANKDKEIERLENKNFDLTAQIKELREQLNGHNGSGGHSTTGGTGNGGIVDPPPTTTEGISPQRQLEIKTRIVRQCEAMDKEIDRGGSWRSQIIGTMAPTLRSFNNMEERRYAHDLYKAHLESQKNFSSMYIFTEYCTKLIK